MKSNLHIWDEYMLFFSSTYTQKFLHNCYEREEVEKAEQISYENCYPFIYYLEHSKNYYDLSQTSPLAIKPVLLFYGMSQLLKACLLTVTPDYPENTSVLAHGVSARKRKKQGYDFLDDEVKIQKNGLFTHVSSKMFHMKQFEGNKYCMRSLMKTIPELTSFFQSIYKQENIVEVGNLKEGIIQFPNELIANYHMDNERFLDYLTNQSIIQLELVTTENGLRGKVNREQIDLSNALPFMYDLYKDSFYFPKNRNWEQQLPEVLTHYLLLYNLSMISRYETEWWYELLHTYTSKDYPFITQFLSITSDKIPYFLLSFLETKKH
ncbi:YaaC family protein [Bacillus sp. CGMCC 1.16541]|uniref:YaaC family protein n=1 Tax=Bacillus sp. CGMCC 1.16541 TaxID=2185143 RepID=UPI000D733F96|nr:YaaC family protein [Bacillus sp. CGMCC 1.16541]